MNRKGLSGASWVALLAWIASAPNASAQCADWAEGFGPGAQGLGGWSTLAYDATGLLGPPTVYAAGTFKSAGGIAADCVRWDGDHWSPLGTDPNAFGAAAWVLRLFLYDDPAVPWGTKDPVFEPLGLYACGGGFFGNAEALARWNGQAWVSEGYFAIDGDIRVLEVYDDGGGPALFAGGWASDFGWYAVWKRGDLGWHSVNPPYPVRVNDFSVFDDGSGAALYAACAFPLPPYGGRVLRLKGTQWEEVGGLDFGGAVLAVEAVDTPQGAVLTAGGEFRTVGNAPAKGLVVWDGTSWSELGGGVSGGVNALQAVPNGSHQDLFVAGSFDHAGAIPAANIARWDGERWTALGAGIEGEPSCIVPVDGPTGRSVWVGGSIQGAGGKPSSDVARWDDECTCTPQSYCTAKTSSQGCIPSISSSGTASASSTLPCWIEVAQVPAQTPGLFVYTLNGPATIPFAGGTLCVQPPLARTPAQLSGGDPLGAPCSGTLSLDVNAWIQSGVDPGLVVGNLVAMQAWFRDGGDPAGAGTSDAVAFRICD